MTDIRWITAHLAKTRLYKKFQSYYDGDHISILDPAKHQQKLGYAVLKMLNDTRDNLCPLVVNTIADRLQLSGFTSETNQEIPDEIWAANKLPLLTGEAHATAARLGECCISVWPDENKLPRIYVEHPSNIAMHYDARGNVF